MFQIIKTKNEETNNDQWTLQRVDGKSWEDGVVGWNFDYTDEGGLAALNCMERLNKRYNLEVKE
jgi:hypothetical protein